LANPHRRNRRLSLVLACAKSFDLSLCSSSQFSIQSLKLFGLLNCGGCNSG